MELKSLQTENPIEIRLEDVILPHFHDYWWESKHHTYTHYVCKGGRNSSKSTTLAIDCIETLLSEDVNGLAIRKVERTLMESVFEQLKEATDLLGVSNQFKFYTSPLRVVNLAKGNYILFRGADDPKKIKSIKTANFPIGFVWFEELDEFKTEEEVDVIINSILRKKLPDGLRYKILYSYNPPKRKQNWINKKFESKILPSNVYVHHSDYTCNYHLSEQTLFEIEETKRLKPQKYEWMFLGKPIGGGVIPFDNLEFRKITNDEIENFDNIRQGIDWGYSVDPLAFVRWHYDKTRRRIYALDEIYGVKISNRELAKRLKEKDYYRTLSLTDREPKSHDEMKSYSIKVKMASKPPGSVEYGEKWLDDLEAIIIDPERTPNIAKEFEEIDYQVDRDGNTLPRLMDKNNHTIDATRYAFERDMRFGNWYRL